MSGVIDIRQDVNVDIANAKAIGNIFSAIGRGEQLRQKKYQIDTYLQAMQSSGGDVVDSIQFARDAVPAPYDTGLGGILQRIGRVTGGPPRDYTEGITQQLLAQQMKENDPAYKLGLQEKDVNVQGKTQDISQSKELFPLKKTGMELGNTVTQTNISGAEQGQRESASAFPLEQRDRELRIKGEEQNQQLALKVEGRAVTAAATADRINKLHEQGLIDTQQHQSRMNPLIEESASLKLDLEKETNPLNVKYMRAKIDALDKNINNLQETVKTEQTMRKFIADNSFDTYGNRDLTPAEKAAAEAMANHIGKTIKWNDKKPAENPWFSKNTPEQPMTYDLVPIQKQNPVNTPQTGWGAEQAGMDAIKNGESPQAAQPQTDQYTVGQKMTKNGTVYTYMGNGKWSY